MAPALIPQSPTETTVLNRVAQRPECGSNMKNVKIQNSLNLEYTQRH